MHGEFLSQQSWLYSSTERVQHRSSKIRSLMTGYAKFLHRFQTLVVSTRSRVMRHRPLTHILNDFIRELGLSAESDVNLRPCVGSITSSRWKWFKILESRRDIWTSFSYWLWESEVLKLVGSGKQRNSMLRAGGHTRGEVLGVGATCCKRQHYCVSNWSTNQDRLLGSPTCLGCNSPGDSGVFIIGVTLTAAREPQRGTGKQHQSCAAMTKLDNLGSCQKCPFNIPYKSPPRVYEETLIDGIQRRAAVASRDELLHPSLKKMDNREYK
jgi:hypothetical protein